MNRQEKIEAYIRSSLQDGADILQCLEEAPHTLAGLGGDMYLRPCGQCVYRILSYDDHPCCLCTHGEGSENRQVSVFSPFFEDDLDFSEEPGVPIWDPEVLL